MHTVAAPGLKGGEILSIERLEEFEEFNALAQRHLICGVLVGRDLWSPMYGGVRHKPAPSQVPFQALTHPLAFALASAMNCLPVFTWGYLMFHSGKSWGAGGNSMSSKHVFFKWDKKDQNRSSALYGPLSTTPLTASKH